MNRVEEFPSGGRLFEISARVVDTEKGPQVEVVVREKGKETGRYTGTLETAVDYENQEDFPLVDKLIEIAKSEAARIADLPSVIKKAH